MAKNPMDKSLEAQGALSRHLVKDAEKLSRELERYRQPEVLKNLEKLTNEDAKEHSRTLEYPGQHSDFRETADNISAQLNKNSYETQSPDMGFYESPRKPKTGHSRTKIESIRDIGRMIRERRKSINLTQQQLADLAGVGRRFISELEKGKETLEMGKVLGVSLAVGLDIYGQWR